MAHSRHVLAFHHCSMHWNTIRSTRSRSFFRWERSGAGGVGGGCQNTSHK